MRERYEYMTGVKGIGKKKAIAASNLRFAARRLAVVMYVPLKNGTEYEARHLEIRKRSEKTAVLTQEALSA